MSAPLPDIEKVLKQHKLSLDDYDHIKRILGREPNLVEIGIFSAMWSEHCSYKSSKKHLSGFPTKAPWVIQGPEHRQGATATQHPKPALEGSKPHPGDPPTRKTAREGSQPHPTHPTEHTQPPQRTTPNPPKRTGESHGREAPPPPRRQRPPQQPHRKARGGEHHTKK